MWWVRNCIAYDYMFFNAGIVRLTERVQTLGEHRFSEQATFFFSRQIRAYSDAVLKHPDVSPDLLAATPLEGVRHGEGVHAE